VEGLAAAERAAERARLAVVEAKREVEVLVKHGERQAARERREQQRREEREADDLAAARASRRSP
jgi:flagellar biosynthesis chaperone FliJ